MIGIGGSPLLPESPQNPGSAAEPLFPTGAPQDPDVRVLFDNAAGVDVDASTAVPSALAFLQNLTVKVGEQLRITLLSAGGGAVTVNTTYDMGQNSGDLSTQA